MNKPELPGLEVAIFEDDPNMVQLAEINLMHTPHKIVETAQTLDEALAVLNRSQPTGLKLDVVLLDGNLSTPERGHDGRAIWDRISRINQARRHAGRLAIVTIGISGDSLLDYGIPLSAEHDITKAGLVRIDEVLDSIAEQRRAS